MRSCSLLLVLLLSQASAFTPISIAPYRTALAASAVVLPEGLTKTIEKPGDGVPLQRGDIATIQYACYLPSDTSLTPFAKSTKQKVIVGDGTMIDGFDIALRSMRVGEKSRVRINDPQLGYGANGVLPVVPPDAVIEMDLQVLAAQPPTANIDFDSLAMADQTPRTAADIAAAFEARQAARAGEAPAKEGLEGFIEKAKNFYFFGLFEGETGERPPWFLRPSITFPLAFLIVGAAFYVSFVGGAITERGAQIKDELDEVILSSNASPLLMLAWTSLSLPLPL